MSKYVHVYKHITRDILEIHKASGPNADGKDWATKISLHTNEGSPGVEDKGCD